MCPTSSEEQVIKQEPSTSEAEVQQPPLPLAPLAEPVLDEGTFLVERILQSRKRKGKEEFYVKWKGYSSRHNSWEPRENIIGTKLIELFEEDRKHKKRTRRKRRQVSADFDSSPTNSPTGLTQTNMSLRKRRTLRTSLSTSLRSQYVNDFSDDSGDDYIGSPSYSNTESPATSHNSYSYRKKKRLNRKSRHVSNHTESRKPDQKPKRPGGANIKITDVNVTGQCVTFIEYVESSSSEG